MNLLVDLQTDFVPFYDFRSVRIRVRGEEFVYVLQAGDEFFDPGRVAEVQVNTGSTLIVAELLDAGGQVVAERTLAVSIRGPASVRLVISALCRDVRCPSDQTCVQGDCAEPGCDGEDCDLRDPADCPGGVCDESVCSTTMDCEVTEDACSSAECRDTICLYPPIPGSCGASTYCRPGMGCAPIPGDLDAGVPVDGSIGLTDGALPDGGAVFDGAAPDGALVDGGGLDAGQEVCTVCTTDCGTVGRGLCMDGEPTGECLPPPETCSGRDDDCDGEIDEGAACGHSHAVVCEIETSDEVPPRSSLVGSVVPSLPPGTVCAGGICVSSLQNCQTLPGPDGHTHRVAINGSTSVTFGPGTTSLTPGGTSAAPDGHGHAVQCSVFGPSGRRSGTDTYFLNLEETWRDDPLRYNRFCTGLDEEDECFDRWGDCTAL